MSVILLLSSVVIFSCIIAYKFSNKFGMPALLLFMGLGMIFGTDGLFKISFDNYHITEQVCTVALMMIIFYGGFCTKWEVAKPVAKQAVALSTLGVVVTASLVCAFSYYVLRFGFYESFLIGAVISATDAASVFSILRSKKLNLKDGTASILEIESGSNDLISYMLVVIGLALMNSDKDVSISYMIFSQIVYGVLIGIAVALVGVFILKKIKMVTEGLDTIFVIALALISFALPDIIGGNGYLSAYLTGIILGNSKIKNKIPLVHFFDGITGLAQIVIFFLLGLLAFPHKLPSVILPALLIALFLTFIARPIATCALLIPLKSSIRQCMLVSWSGLRGAASIVFTIIIIASGTSLESDLFHIVFMISLLSVAFQGSLLPFVARRTGMVDDASDIRKTFNDYQEESSITLMRLFIPEGHSWENKAISEISMAADSLALMIKRNHENLIPKGDTIILANDSIVFSVPTYEFEEEIHLKEIYIDREHEWCDKSIGELDLPKDILITMIKRGEETIIPRGKSVLKENDIIVIYN